MNKVIKQPANKQVSTNDSLSDKNNQLAMLFKTRREELKITTDELAKLLSLDDPAQVLRWENGEESIPFFEVYSITNALSIDPDDVMMLVHNFFFKK